MGGRTSGTWIAELIDTPKGPMTRREAAKAFGLPPSTLMRRLHLKYPPDKIFTSARHSTTPHSHGGLNHTSFRAKTIDTPKGPMTRREAAKAFNLAYGTLVRRLWLKYPPDKLFSPPVKSQQRPAHRYVRKGEGNPYRMWKTAWGTETSWEIAARVRIKPWSFVMRVQDFNWTLEDAANTPGYGIRGRHFIIPPDEYRRRYQELHGHACTDCL